MTAPTEAEIREAVASRIRHELGNISDITGPALVPISDSDMARSREPSGWSSDFYPEDGHPGTLWTDMTSDEVDALSKAMSEAIDLDELAAWMTDRVVAAAVAFAEAHPEIPRGRYGQPELVTA